ncbi:MAG: DUF4384 domain-containing protein [Thermoguttaceae bacterium]
MRRAGWMLGAAAVWASVWGAFWGAAWAGQPKARFRDLVYKAFEEEDYAAVGAQIGLDQKVELTGLDYKVLLVRGLDDPGTYVDPKTHRFKIGDRIRLTVRPLSKSYLYIYHVGPRGKGKFLVPGEQEQPRQYQAKATITLPEEGYFQFTEPPGDEKVFVVASAKPIADQEALAKVVTSSDDQSDTPAMKEIRKGLNAVIKEVLVSAVEKEQAKRDKMLIYRGLFAQARDRQRLIQEVRSRGVRRGSLELPPQRPGEGTLVLSFRAADLPADVGTGALVTIPLKSEAP